MIILLQKQSRYEQQFDIKANIIYIYIKLRTHRCQIKNIIENICHFTRILKCIMNDANIYEVNIHTYKYI